MLILKRLKTLQHVSIFIQIIRWYCTQANIPLHTERHAHTPNVMLPHHHNWPFTFLNIFKFSDFNKEPTSSLKMIYVGVFLSVLMLTF